MKRGRVKEMWMLCSSLVLAALAVQGEEITFGNRVFKLATANDCTDHNYDDSQNAGSYLLSQRGSNQGLKTLSMDVQLIHYAPTSAACFRAHPVLIGCLQDALSQLKSAKKRALVMGGYRLPEDVASSTAKEDIFAAAGTAITLMPESRNVDDLLGIAQAVLRHCPAKMERIQRNIGVVMKSNAVHVFMGGPTDPPYFKVDGYTLLDDSAFTAQALNAINEGLEMGKKATSCSSFAQLTSGQMYPADATSAEGTVGGMDVAVTRDDTEDFKRLVQYLGTSVQFDNSERSASWCGRPSRPPCVDCKYGPVDATLDKRCTARMMTPRMSDVLTLLQKLTRQTMGDSVRVTKAWDEDYDGHVADVSSLHPGGRALLVKLVSGDTSKLPALSQLAICAKADFVQHDGDHLLIAVRKQSGDIPSEVTFPQAKLVRVDPPTRENYLVSLPEYFKESDLAAQPVFDSAGLEELQVAAHTKLGTFASRQTRYLRLNPYVAECFSKLQDYFVKRHGLDGLFTLELLRGFMTTPERDMAFTSTDHRYASPTLGLSFEVRANSSQSTQNLTLANLARLAITQCTPVFRQADAEIGVGIYHDRVFVDMRDAYKFWNPSGTFSSKVTSSAQFKDYMKQLYEAAADNRIVEPDFPTEAASLAEPPSLQSPDYRYTTPQRIRRRQQATAAPTDCVVTTDTSFCQRSKPFRDRLVAEWWAEAAKKHHYHDEAETKTAFERCFGDCGTCTTGSVYEAKLEHCSNFLHWSPFEMAPEGTSINLFPRERAELRKCACQGGSNHCIEDSALFLLAVNLFEAKYRPDLTKSVSEEMYPQTENPSPVPELLGVLYTAYNMGVAKVWVQDETDIAAMRSVLKTLMVYNRNVTEVKFYVNELSSKDAVDSVLRSLILEWTTGESPLYTREFVAPFTIEDLQPHCKITSKRSAQQHSVRDELIQRINTEDDRLLRFDL